MGSVLKISGRHFSQICFGQPGPLAPWPDVGKVGTCCSNTADRKHNVQCTNPKAAGGRSSGILFFKGDVEELPVEKRKGSIKAAEVVLRSSVAVANEKGSTAYG